MARAAKHDEGSPAAPAPGAAVDVGAAIEKERRRLQRRLDAALKQQKKRQRQLAAAGKSKHKKRLARRRRQAGAATNKVTTLAEKLALLGGSTGVPTVGPVATGEAADASAGDGPDGPA